MIGFFRLLLWILLLYGLHKRYVGKGVLLNALKKQVWRLLRYGSNVGSIRSREGVSDEV